MSLGSVLTAIVTPFDDDLQVDEQAFVELLHHLAAHGSDGFVVCGTTGEASTLTDEEHLRVVELAVQERPPGSSIIAGTGSNDTRHAVHLTERATALGLGGCGGICVASHLVGEEMRRMVDEPEHRAEIDASLRDVYAAMGVTTNPIPVKAALEMAGHPVGGLRLP